MFSFKFILTAVIWILGALTVFGLFLIEAFHAAQLSISSAGRDELLYLAGCFLLSLVFVIASLQRAQLKFQANGISVQRLTYFFMATALAGFLWSFSFFSWCATYHRNEFLHPSAERYFRTAFLGSILGSFLLGLLAISLSNAHHRRQR